MKVLSVIVIISLFAGALYAQSCLSGGTSATNGQCFTCSYTNGYSCGGTTFGGQVSCAQFSNIPSGSNPCNIATSQSTCVAAANITTTPGNIYTSEAINTILQACQNRSSNMYNNACCPSNVCPTLCSGVSNNQAYSTTQPITGANVCYEDCSSCSGGGYTTSWCNSNCGTESSGHAFACSGVTDNCCSVGSGSTLTSFLSILF